MATATNPTTGEVREGISAAEVDYYRGERWTISDETLADPFPHVFVDGERVYPGVTDAVASLTDAAGQGADAGESVGQALDAHGGGGEPETPDEPTSSRRR